jgi:general secretion pathway protein I
LSRPMPSRRRRSEAGFTLVEVLVAIAIVAVALTAIGSLMAAAARGTRSIDEHLTLVETARAIEAALPDRQDLNIGGLTGERGDYRWRVDVLPFRPSFVEPTGQTAWAPRAVIITVQSPDGPVLRVNSIRLARVKSP